MLKISTQSENIEIDSDLWDSGFWLQNWQVPDRRPPAEDKLVTATCRNMDNCTVADEIRASMSRIRNGWVFIDGRERASAEVVPQDDAAADVAVRAVLCRDRRPGHRLGQALALEHRLGPQQLAVLPFQFVVPRAELAELDLALGVARLDLGEALAQQGRVLGQAVRGGHPRLRRVSGLGAGVGAGVGRGRSRQKAAWTPQQRSAGASGAASGSHDRLDFWSGDLAICDLAIS